MIEHLLSIKLFKTAIHAAKMPASFNAQTASFRIPYPKGTSWFLKFLTVFFFAVGLGTPFLGSSDWFGRAMLICFAICFVGFSLKICGEAFGNDVFYDDFHLTASTSILGTTKQIPWNEITSTQYSTAFCWFVLKSTRGKKIRISRFRTGFNDFTQSAYKHLTPEAANEFSALIAVYHDKGTADP